VVEQELKFALANRGVFDQLLSALGPPQQSLQQANHYFSTQAEWPDPLWTLRLRQENDQFEVTLKSGRRQLGNFFEAREINHPVSPTEAQQFLSLQWPEPFWQWPPLQVLRGEFGVQAVVLVGSLRNHRHCCPQPSGWMAELDETFFPDGSIDYELEVETNQPQRVLAELEPYRELLGSQDKTKYRRFLERRVLNK
jgi:uncharacterized protein YjbK